MASLPDRFMRAWYAYREREGLPMLEGSPEYTYYRRYQVTEIDPPLARERIERLSGNAPPSRQWMERVAYECALEEVTT